MSQEPLAEPKRKEVFGMLVRAQDRQMGVAESRRLVSHRYDLSEEDVRRIESEGLEEGWPPL
jgi:hypothetical protein